MSAQLTDVTNQVLTIRVSGQLTQRELADSQRAAGEVIKRLGKARLLIVIEDFHGTANDGDWGDISFQMHYDSFIERIAVVCESRWKEAAMLFTGKGIRRVAIETFEPRDLVQAREWVSAG